MTQFSTNGSQPDPEVKPKKKRRRFTAKYKRQILEEADRCTQPGEVGALLRREGLYSSHLSQWREQREAGELAALTPKKRGRKQAISETEREVARLKRENEQLKIKLEQANVIIEVQKKLSDLIQSRQEKPDESK